MDGERVGTIEGDRDQQRRRSGERQVHVQLTFEHGLLSRSSVCMYHSINRVIIAGRVYLIISTCNGQGTPEKLAEVEK